MSVWNKLDSGLASIYSNYLKVREHGAGEVAQVHDIVAAGGRINVILSYDGDLAEIAALGFDPIWDDAPGLATGTIDLADLERLAAHPAVRKMSYPRKGTKYLDQSVPDIKANSVWSQAGGAFTGTTGKGVIVGVIDDGIDYKHPFFRLGEKTTRILRIWDPGLTAGTGEKAPDAGLLSGPSYGVEYTDQHINDILQDKSGALKIRHRNCGGHGTHVASIAAGDGRDKFKYIGVAPEANLIIVKYFDQEAEPTIGGTQVPAHTQFKDAVLYILNTAKAIKPADPPPVVINCSFGDDTSPHDGFTLDEDFLTSTFDPASSAGKILVNAAGNSGNLGLHAIIHFAPPDNLETTILFDLVDKRTKKTKSDRCFEEPDFHNLEINMFYPKGPAIEVQLVLPDEEILPIDGPAIGAGDVSDKFSGRTYRMMHKIESEDLKYTHRGTVERTHFLIEVQPNDKHEHKTGTYEVRIKSATAVDVHVWCFQPNEGFQIKLVDDPPVSVTKTHTIGKNGGAANIVTVGGYSAEDTNLPVIFFSGHGPLANYGYPATLTQPDKPEIAAPGWKIDAASSRDTRKKSKKRKLTTQKMGTSMSAPHVTGAIALMLQKNKALTAKDVVKVFEDHPRTGDTVATTAEEAKFGRLDAKKAVDNAGP